jgi:hypothetical protein
MPRAAATARGARGSEGASERVSWSDPRRWRLRGVGRTCAARSTGCRLTAHARMRATWRMKSATEVSAASIFSVKVFKNDSSSSRTKHGCMRPWACGTRRRASSSTTRSIPSAEISLARRPPGGVRRRRAEVVREREAEREQQLGSIYARERQRDRLAGGTHHT